jgi:hypothetical protein
MPETPTALNAFGNLVNSCEVMLWRDAQFKACNHTTLQEGGRMVV